MVKSADGTLASFPAVTVASVSSNCNLWWLRFCPRLSRCRGQHLRPVISSSYKPENQKPTRESWKGSVRKKAVKSAHYRQTFPFFCISSLYFSSSPAHIVALITYNLLSKRSSAICVRIFGAFLGSHCMIRENIATPKCVM